MLSKCRTCQTMSAARLMSSSCTRWLVDFHQKSTRWCRCRLFGGLIQDVKRKWKWYISDFTDAIHVQCFASFVYLFLATLTPNVTFGGLLGVATKQYMVSTSSGLCANSWVGGSSSVCDIFIKKKIATFTQASDKHSINKLFADLK